MHDDDDPRTCSGQRKSLHHQPDQYQQQWQASIDDNDAYWRGVAEDILSWDRPFHTVSDCDFEAARIGWFLGGQLNACYNCVDRHLPTRANQTAFLYEGDEPGDVKHITYRELHDRVCQLANVLIRRGVKKGDRVAIYMPMVPEAAMAMLACARIGAIHSVIFAGFSADSLRDRILDADCRVV